MDVAKLQAFFAKEIEDCKKQDILLSLHLKAAMMKASPLETPPFARRCLSVIPSVDPVEETQGDDIARAVVYALGVDRLLHLRAESLEQENFFLAQNCHLGVIAIQVPQKGLACITENGWAQQMHEISERSSGQGRPAHISQVQWEWWILTTRLLALQLKVMLPNLFDFMSALCTYAVRNRFHYDRF